MEHLTGFAPLAARYDGFILDMWGVLHDGVTAFPEAVEALRRLRGRPVVLLSNAPRRADAARHLLRRLGIGDDLYTGLVTSGEAVHALLRDRTDPWFARLGRRLFHLGPARDRNVFEGLDLEPVPAPEAAEFVLNTGPDDEAPSDPEAYDGVLARAAARRLPMVCANPDLEVMRGGRRVICAGLLAQRYAALGGEVRSVGKPDPAIYRPVLALLGLPRARVLAVGDSLRTDIAGAAAAGLDSAWVLGGIDEEIAADPAAALARAGLSPVAILPAFCW
jgi:HAD superfamily hydrolase (TIGR01459 family)